MRPPSSYVRVTTESLHNLSTTKPDAGTVQENVAMDTIGLSIGPMPTRTFLDRFLPKDRPLDPVRVAHNTFDAVRPGKSTTSTGERAMYDAFVCFATPLRVQSLITESCRSTS